MSVVVKHNPQLLAKLRSHIDSPPALLQYVEGLTHKERRTAGYQLAELLLPELDETRFWALFKTFVPHDAKAYLGTFLKAAGLLYLNRRLTFDGDELLYFARHTATAVDRQKFLSAMLPLLRDAAEVRLLLDRFDVTADEVRLIYLFKAGTGICYFCLFNLLKQHDGDVPLLGKYCMLLLRKADALSQKTASLINDYFGLGLELPRGLKPVEPYKLSKLNGNYSTFQYIINQI